MKNYTTKLKDALASALKRFVMWLECLLVGHDWLYTSERPIQESWSRECRRCEKRQHQEYDEDGFPLGWKKGWKAT